LFFNLNPCQGKAWSASPIRSGEAKVILLILKLRWLRNAEVVEEY
jgi:hypothetical protein